MTDQLEYGGTMVQACKVLGGKSRCCRTEECRTGCLLQLRCQAFDRYDDSTKDPANTWGVELNYAF